MENFSLNFNTATLIFSMYLIFTVILYYIIFHKHHKKNKICLDELISLLSNFFVTTTVSVLFLSVGIYIFIDAFNYLDERIEVISHFIVAILVISIDILNYIYYIKRKLVDVNIVERINIRKNTLKVGEVIQFIVFILIFLVPFFKIPYFVSIKENYSLLITELLKYIGLSIASIIILINLNPLDFIHGFKKCVLRKNIVDDIVKDDSGSIEELKENINEILKNESDAIKKAKKSRTSKNKKANKKHSKKNQNKSK